MDLVEPDFRPRFGGRIDFDRDRNQRQPDLPLLICACRHVPSFDGKALYRRMFRWGGRHQSTGSVSAMRQDSMVSTTDSISVRVVVLSFMPIAWCSISPSPRGVMARRPTRLRRAAGIRTDCVSPRHGFRPVPRGWWWPARVRVVRMRHRLHDPTIEDHFVHELLEPIAAFVADRASLPIACHFESKW